VLADPGCVLAHPAPQTCMDGAIGDAGPESFGGLADAEVRTIVEAAAAALDGNTATIAVVDRSGLVLALFREPGADPLNDDQAVGVARTAAFFSHDMAPLSSRTVRFISGIHFPPGVTNTASAALYGIENTNRGCDFNALFNPGKCLVRARSTNGLPCNAADPSGCGPGIVTGKQQPADASASSVNAGGIPLYRITGNGLDRADEGIVTNGKLVGGIGVVGIPGDPQLAEFAAVTGAFASLATGLVPVPAFPLPEPGNVFIDGIRLPFLGPAQKLTFNDDGLPTGIARPQGTAGGGIAGTYRIAPRHGGCAPNGYLVGPNAGTLTAAAVDEIVQRAVSAAKRTRAAIRLPRNSYTRMVIAVADVDGTLLAIYRMPDATIFSIDVAVAKSRNVVYFSGNDASVRTDLPGVPAGTAITNRTLGFGSQPFFPPGIDSPIFDPAEGPFYQSLFLRDLANPCSQGSQAKNANQNGVVFFAGASPLYRNGVLVGGLGVSGDGIEQDDYVTVLGAGDLLPDEDIRADRIRIDGARLPMFKFPRQPEGVTECGGGPCD
jgi:uncharacterized protein GlcG (DUF336 family)